MSAHILPDPLQIAAADPRQSVFVTANAGSGKTTTLVNRVARLLLQGVQPGEILCVTYTKAAAAEMQARLFQRLGDWAVMGDQELEDSLADLGGQVRATLSADELSKARNLFAKALDTPGGLKIQTLHAFCEKLLRRFPLEAGASRAPYGPDKPKLKAFLQTIHARPAYQRALERGGPYAYA